MADLLQKHAQVLRRTATKEENHLWYDFLRTHPVQFRRQVVIDRYIVDFYCAQAALVVELDGGQHYEEAGANYDVCRTAELEQLGKQVIRFSNLDIRQNFEGVCMAIDHAVKDGLARPHPSRLAPCHLPPEGEGQ